MISVHKQIVTIQYAMRCRMRDSEQGRLILKSQYQDFTKAGDILYITVIKESHADPYSSIRVHHENGMTMLLDYDHARESTPVNIELGKGSAFFITVVDGSGHDVYCTNFTDTLYWELLISAIDDVYKHYIVLEELYKCGMKRR